MSTLKGLRVHVEGMGLTGCLLAYHLEKAGADWSWHDIDAPFTAWKASTGAIYPAGQPGSLDYECWRVWAEWLQGQRLYPLAHFEPATYWFNHLSPPHHGDYEFYQDGKNDLRRAGPLSYHLNAQTFVPATRRKFKARMVGSAPGHLVGRDAYVVAHGFSERLDHVLWGWTVPVKLKLPHYMCGGYRPALYFRRGRFVMAYAYPAPGTEYWYAGSSLIHQREPRELEVEAKFERWRRDFETLANGAIRVTDRGAGSLQGWRPAEGDGRVDPVVKRSLRRSEVRLTVPPLWHSGIRHFPRVLQQLLGHLSGIKGRR